MANNDYILDAFNSLGLLEFSQVFDLKLKEKGRRLKGNCPMHGGDSESFAVYVTERGRIAYNCSTKCGSGRAIDLIGHLNGLEPKGKSFIQLLDVIAEKLGLPGPGGPDLTEAQKADLEKRRELVKRAQIENAIWQRDLSILTTRVLTVLRDISPIGLRAVEYLRKHKVFPSDDDQARAVSSQMYLGQWRTQANIKELLSQFSPEELNRVFGDGRDFIAAMEARPLMCFATAPHGEIVAMQARSINPHCQKKFRFISYGEISKGFFNAEELIAKPSAPVLLLEGLTDTIAAASFRDFGRGYFKQDPAIIGKSGSGRLTPVQIEMLKNRDVVIMFDGDDAGEAGAIACVNALKPFAASVTFSNLEKDLCELLNE